MASMERLKVAGTNGSARVVWLAGMGVAKGRD